MNNSQYWFLVSLLTALNFQTTAHKSLIDYILLYLVWVVWIGTMVEEYLRERRLEKLPKSWDITLKFGDKTARDKFVQGLEIENQNLTLTPRKTKTAPIKGRPRKSAETSGGKDSASK